MGFRHGDDIILFNRSHKNVALALLLLIHDVPATPEVERQEPQDKIKKRKTAMFAGLELGFGR